MVAATHGDIFERALDSGLARQEIVDALELFPSSDRDAVASQLREFLNSTREEIIGRFAADLEQLEARKRDLDAAIEDAVAGLAAAEPATASAISRLRAQLPDAYAQVEDANETAAALDGEAQQLGARSQDLRAAVNTERIGRPRTTTLRRLLRRPLPGLWDLTANADEADRRYSWALSTAREATIELTQAVTSASDIERSLEQLTQPLRDRVEREPPPPVVAAQGAYESYREIVERALVESGVLEFARPWLSERLEAQRQTRYRLDLKVASAAGLAELPNPDYEISTEAADRLQRLLDRLPGGSVGVSGPRGAGKTTLIRLFCERGRPVRDTPPALSFMVSAPVDYAPLDFVLYLFATACRSALPVGWQEDPIADEYDVRRWAQRALPGLAIAAVAASSALVVLGGAFATAALREQRLGAETWVTILATVAGVGSAAILLLTAFDRLRLGAMRPYFAWGVSRPNAEVWIWRIGIALALAAIAGVTYVRGTANRAPVATMVGVALLLAIGIGLPPLLRLVSFRGPRDQDDLRLELKRWASYVVRDAVSLTGLILAAGAVAVVALALGGRSPDLNLAAGLILIAIGGVLARDSVLLHRITRGAVERRPRTDSNDEALDSLQLAARARLREITHQQSVSSGWSGKVALPQLLKVPLTVEAAATATRSLSERPWTFPEAVTYFQTFLTMAGSSEPVLVGIDELDKMSPDGAEGFLNAMKGIFGVRNCYFLVSVSEDALASFERRGLPFRDVFDSSFDEILRVRYLSLSEAEQLLSKRVIGMPLPFVALCYVVSGGLARDLIRTARAIFELRDTLGNSSLKALCGALVTAEFASKREASIVALRRIGVEEALSVLNWLGAVDANDASASTLLSTGCPPIPTRATGDEERAQVGEVVRATAEFLGYWYFCATLLDVFNDALDLGRIQVAERLDDRGATFQTLAVARQEFSTAPSVAWSRLSAFRDAFGGIDALDPVGMVSGVQAPAPPPPALTRDARVAGAGSGDPSRGAGA